MSMSCWEEAKRGEWRGRRRGRRDKTNILPAAAAAVRSVMESSRNEGIPKGNSGKK